jgi:hypothetical protein
MMRSDERVDSRCLRTDCCDRACRHRTVAGKGTLDRRSTRVAPPGTGHGGFARPLIWGDELPNTAIKSVHNHGSRIRTSTPNLIDTGELGYRFRVASDAELTTTCSLTWKSSSPPPLTACSGGGGKHS